ncbi:uncharacterized protein LOC131892113 [Tigriopus californicus]|uniref:uncharacterized protein LOC131892113 n=1 Tax=Tigriopus californicus TaxID=6832 RepID=UPI0027DA0E6A|nr:uncharacterized protein LOC131892113 [Tigriopus californicus]
MWTTAKSFLKETSIHGFSHIADDQNGVERLVWSVIMVTAITTASFMIVQTMNEAYENPLTTSVQSIPITDIPFPAVTIEVDEELNPWGYTEKALELVDYRGFEGDVSKFREDFHFFFKKIADVMNKYLMDEFFRGNISQIREELVTWLLYPSLLKDYPMKLATLKQNLNSTTFAKLDERISEVATGEIASSCDGKWFYTDVVVERLQFLDEALAEHNLTLTCTYDNLNCEEHLKYGYLRTFLPVLISLKWCDFRKMKGQSGFGHFLSFFIQEVYSFYPGTPAFKLNQPMLARTRMKLGKLELNSQELTHLLTPGPGYTAALYLEDLLTGPFQCDIDNYKAAWEWFRKGVEPEYESQMGFQPFVNQRPCLNDSASTNIGIAGCCALWKQIQINKENVLRIMKYAIQPPTFLQPVDEFFADFNTTLFPNYRKLKANDDQLKNYRARVLWCQKLQGQMLKPTAEDCQHFARGFTNKGMAYTFNNERFWDMYNNSDANAILHNIMHPELNASQVVYPLTNGPLYGLRYLIQPYKVDHIILNKRVLPRKEDLIPGNFRISIHDPQNVPDLRNDYIELKGGFTYTVLVSPSQLITNEDAKSIEIHRRNCRFHFENANMKILRNYSQTGCFMECQLGLALEKCGCIPWNYPRFGAEESICDHAGTECFSEVMENITLRSKQCTCPVDCHRTKYSYSVFGMPTNVVESCKTNTDFYGQYNIMDYFPLNDFVRLYQDIADPEISFFPVNDEDCRNHLKHSAIVQVQLATSDVLQINSNIRVSLADYLSSLGGTVGLFSGASLLSLIEILLWFLRSIPGVFMSCRYTKQDRNNRNVNLS